MTFARWLLSSLLSSAVVTSFVYVVMPRLPWQPQAQEFYPIVLAMNLASALAAYVLIPQRPGMKVFRK